MYRLHSNELYLPAKLVAMLMCNAVNSLNLKLENNDTENMLSELYLTPELNVENSCMAFRICLPVSPETICLTYLHFMP